MSKKDVIDPEKDRVEADASADRKKQAELKQNTKKTITKEQGKKRLKQIDSAPDIEELKNAKIPTRRVRMLMVNPVDFMWLFTKGLAFRKQLRIIDGVPEDAKLVAVMADSVRNGIMLVVESATYDEIPINAMPPVQPVEISTGVKDATKKKKTARKKK